MVANLAATNFNLSALGFLAFLLNDGKVPLMNGVIPSSAMSFNLSHRQKIKLDPPSQSHQVHWDVG
jgi:hypothetical protein